jgi:hypothetical protein
VAFSSSVEVAMPSSLSAISIMYFIGVSFVERLQLHR